MDIWSKNPNITIWLPTYVDSKQSARWEVLQQTKYIKTPHIIVYFRKNQALMDIFSYFMELGNGLHVLRANEYFPGKKFSIGTRISDTYFVTPSVEITLKTTPRTGDKKLNIW